MSEVRGNGDTPRDEHIVNLICLLWAAGVGGGALLLVSVLWAVPVVIVGCALMFAIEHNLSALRTEQNDGSVSP